MQGQGTIIGVGALEYPAECQGAAEETLAELRRQQDHHAHLDLRPPHHPGRPVRRVPAQRPRAAARRARLLRRDLRARCASRTSRSAGSRDIDDLARRRRRQDRPGAGADPRLPRARPPDGRHRPARVPAAHATPTSTSPTHGLTLWDLDREFATGGFGGKPMPEAARHPRRAARLVLPHDRHRVHAHPGPRAARMDPGAARGPATPSPPATSSCASCAGSTRPRRSRRSCRPSTSARSASRSRAASRSSRCSTRSCRAPPSDGLDEVVIGMAHRGRLNVLANIAGKTYGQIFREFEGNQDPTLGAGLRRREVPPRHRGHLHRRGRRARPRSTSPPTRRTSRRSTRCSRASCAPSRTASTSAATASPCCRCSSTATPRSPARASSPRRSTCRSCAATAPAARSTSSSTTRSASPPSPSSSRSSIVLAPTSPG